jgi:hypothetical protein
MQRFVKVVLGGIDVPARSTKNHAKIEVKVKPTGFL